MESKRIEKFGEVESTACYEISKFKWHDGFFCKRPGCDSSESREGVTPYSKQCKKCGRDESATAHTVFDKLRMSRATALAMVGMVVNSRKRFTVVQLTQQLITAGYTDANERSVWKLLNKIYDRMNSGSFIYDEAAVVIMEIKRKQMSIVSKGKSNGEYRYNAQAVKTDREFHNFIRAYTQENCKVAFFVGKKINTEKASVKRGNIQYRENLVVEDKIALSIVTNFHPWIDYKQPYLFLRNGGTYEQLMKDLTCLPH